jgi:hypothetical protein
VSLDELFEQDGEWFTAVEPLRGEAARGARDAVR